MSSSPASFCQRQRLAQEDRAVEEREGRAACTRRARSATSRRAGSSGTTGSARAPSRAGRARPPSRPTSSRACATGTSRARAAATRKKAPAIETAASTGPADAHAPARVEVRRRVRDGRDDDRSPMPTVPCHPPCGWTPARIETPTSPSSTPTRRSPVERSLGTKKNASSATKIGTDEFATAAVPESTHFSPYRDERERHRGVDHGEHEPLAPAANERRARRSGATRTRRAPAPRTAAAGRSTPPARGRGRRP